MRVDEVLRSLVRSYISDVQNISADRRRAAIAVMLGDIVPECYVYVDGWGENNWDVSFLWPSKKEKDAQEWALTTEKIIADLLTSCGVDLTIAHGVWIEGGETEYKAK